MIVEGGRSEMPQNNGSRWKARLIKRNSKLGQAIAALDTIGDQVPMYGERLEKIATSDQSTMQFERVAGSIKSAYTSELVAKLLDCVVNTSIEASMAEPRAGDDTESLTKSLVAEHRDGIAPRYKPLYKAINLLEEAFRLPAVSVTAEIVATQLSSDQEGQKRDAIRIEGLGSNLSDDLPLRNAVEAYSIELGLAKPGTNNPGVIDWLQTIRFANKTVPDFLDVMRRHLATREKADYASLSEFPTGRNRGIGADRRAFTTMLADRIAKLIGSPHDDFVAAMTTILYDNGKAYSLEASRRLRKSESKRKKGP